MIKKNLFLTVRPRFVWLSIILPLFFTTLFSYIFKEQERKLRVFTQDKLIATLEDTYLLQTRLLDVVNAKGKLEIELKDARQETQNVRDELRKEKTARGETELRFAAVMKENEDLRAALPKSKRAVSLDKIVLKKTGKISRVRKNKTFSVNLGRVNNLKKRDMISVYRDNEFIGKAEVVRIKRKSSTASILPNWQDVVFKKGDEVRFDNK